MKKLLTFLLVIFSLHTFGQTPALQMLVYPKYIEASVPHHGIPYVYRAKITGLKPGLTYRYHNKIVPVAASTAAPYYLYILPPANVIPGQQNYTPGDFYRPPLATTGTTNGTTGALDTDYGLLKADDQGTYTGWFIQETVKERTEGLLLVVRISLNNPEAVGEAALSTIAYKLSPPAADQLIAINMQPTANTTKPKYGTAIRSTSATLGKAKNIVILYDNVEGTGRPIASTFIENDGTTGPREDASTGLGAFYYDHVDGKPNTWGTMILNTDAKGIRRIEQRSLEDGSLIGYHTSADGEWPDGNNPGQKVSTVLTKLGADDTGTTALVLDGSILTLGAPQTVTFTNTFPATYKVGDPNFTLSASSSVGLSDFKYTVDKTGILEITGNTVKIIGGGTAVITVTEPGTKTTSAGTATQSITVDALPQAITGLPTTLAATYGDENLMLTAKGGESANPVVYTSTDATIAEVAGNKIIFKKGGVVTIKANQPGNPFYNAAPEVTSILTVAKATLDVIAEDKEKVTGNVNPPATFIYGAFKNQDDATVITGNPILSTVAETSSPVGEYAIIVDVSELISDQYAFNPVNGKLLVKNKVVQIITFSDFPATAVYGTKPIVLQISSNSTNAFTFTSSNPNVAVAEKNALGEWTVKVKSVGEAAITASQAGDLIYVPGSATERITISKATLTVTAEDKAKLTGAADPAFTVWYDGFVYGDGPAQLSGALQFNQQADGGAYKIIPLGLTSANYNIIFVNGKLTEGSTAFAALHKIYGDVAFDPGASATVGTPVYTVANTAVAVVNTTGLIEIKGAGTTTITATFTGGASAVATLLVDKKVITVIPDAKTKEYAQINPVLTAVVTGLAYGETESVLTTYPQLSTLADLNSGAGKYAINATGGVSNNYTFSYQQGALTVTKAAFAFTFANFPAVNYGDANFTPVTTTNFGAQPVFSSDNTNVASIEKGTVKIKNAGTANITASFAGTDNYIGGTITKQMVVAKRMLVVQPESRTGVYGLANRVLTGTYTGFVNNETAAVITAPAIYSTIATPSSPAGLYTISAASASALNYSFTYLTGTLTVGQAVLTVTADNKTKVYGTPNPEFTFRYTGFANGENATVIKNGALANTVATATSPVGTYPIIPSNATDGNYTFNYIGGILTVSTIGRTIVLDPLPVKFVGDADFTPFAVLSSGETVVFTSGDASVATIVNNKIHIIGTGKVSITATAPVNPNYSSAPTITQLLVINKTQQTITFESVPTLGTDGKTYTLKATSTSGLPVSFAVSDPSSLSLNGDVIKGLRIGKIQITASQTGSSQYAAAPVVINDVQIADAEGDKIKVFPALSINGDGVNEFLTIDGIKDYPNNKVTIINRNGSKVFEIEGYDNAGHVFTGKSQAGASLPQGTYFALITYYELSKQKQKTGFFILKY